MFIVSFGFLSNDFLGFVGLKKKRFFVLFFIKYKYPLQKRILMFLIGCLLVDVLFELISFLIHHYVNGEFN